MGEQDRKLSTAYILWLFLGLFGAHRFYLGYLMSAVIYLFTLGLFGFGWIVDCFLMPELLKRADASVRGICL